MKKTEKLQKHFKNWTALILLLILNLLRLCVGESKTKSVYVCVIVCVCVSLNSQYVAVMRIFYVKVTLPVQLHPPPSTEVSLPVCPWKRTISTNDANSPKLLHAKNPDSDFTRFFFLS